jgi:hypothetical protein
MSKKHNDYEIKIAKEIAEIRRTGLVNMFFLNDVLELMFVLGYNDTAEYIKMNRTEYLNLLELSGDY